MRRDAHVLVIGGGPAGSATAIGLARRGARVSLCEAKAFPRVKVCGEFLSPAAVAALDEIVGVDALRGAGARIVRDVVVEVGDRAASYRLKRAGLALSRAALDALLLARAREIGVEIRQPAPVRSVKLSDAGACALLASGEAIAADAVVHADGSGALDPAGAAKRRRDVLGFKRHFTTDAARAIVGVRMRACAGAYIGTVQVEGSRATCALIASRRLVREHRGEAASMLRAALPAGRADAILGGSARPAEDSAVGDVDYARWLSCGGPGSRLVAGGHPRSFRVGDAASGIEPIAGEGIAFALHSGLTLAASFEPADLLGGQRRLADAMRRSLRLQRLAARAAGALLAREGLMRALWPALQAPAAAIGLWCAATGK